ncbi:hypothetical protein UlMin_035442 [Ulmus minor]
MDSSISEMPMGVVCTATAGYESYDSASQQFSMSSQQMIMGADNAVSMGFPMTHMQMGQNEAKANSTFQSQQFPTPHNQMGQARYALNNLEQMATPYKRKAPLEPLLHRPTLQQSSLANKRMAQMEHRPWMQPVSVPNKRTVQLESLPNSPGTQNLPTPKRMTKTDSFSNKSVSQRTSTSQKNQTARVLPSPKSSTESSESVRSKMREQLAAALSLVNQQEKKLSNVGDNSGAANSLGSTQGNAQPAENSSSHRGDDGNGESQNMLAALRTGDPTLASMHDEKDFQPSNAFSYEDVPFSDNFFVKDELLQGNGLSWVLESDLEMVNRGLQDDGKQLDQEKQILSPEQLAFNIEAELFKLFGGVNKKYKEKGRSLLFNLKDPSNPELRERVMRGEISPERLCSMTAEELASKELSEWRMAKAEELAQMVVLPDTDVDPRRLVKKTHKGEFQVEVEQDVSVPEDISGGTSSVSQSRPKRKEREVPSSKSGGGKGKGNTLLENKNEDNNTSYTLTIPSSDSSDIMQGLMVDDGFKDADFLPPIVSLDEFMESLNSEPPFENLPVDKGRKTPVSDEGDLETQAGSKFSDQTSKVIVDESKAEQDKADASPTNSDADVKVKSVGSHADGKVKSVDSHAVVKLKSSDTPERNRDQTGKLKREQVWEGSLQINISTTVTAIGFFESGEKTSASDWPGFLEIKGRVRLDAFEKFLRELPQSRSRAVMVVHFVVKEGSSESESSSLREVTDSYITDERVGFAEPALGVELYLCPPHIKTLEKLGKIIHKEHFEALNTIDNGLIGVIVWRKLISTSPKSSSSHHKHVSKKQNFTPRRQQDSNLNVNFTHKPAPSRASLSHTDSRPPPGDDDDDDDVPPGFGPPASREVDDLPEFNFSSGSNPLVSQYSGQNPGMGFRPSQPSRPVDQVRELIHKYGQNNSSTFSGGAGVQPWNDDDDDDDDIPEWQPQPPHQQQPTPQVQNFQQPALRPHSVNQQPYMGVATQQQQPAHQTMLPMQQQGTWWVPPAQPDAGQLYGTPGRGTNAQTGVNWQQINAPKSRGF